MPALDGVLETVLYVEDLVRADAFYRGAMGLRCIHEDFRMRAYDVAGRGVLLLNTCLTVEEGLPASASMSGT